MRPVAQKINKTLAFLNEIKYRGAAVCLGHHES